MQWSKLILTTGIKEQPQVKKEKSLLLLFHALTDLNDYLKCCESFTFFISSDFFLMIFTVIFQGFWKKAQKEEVLKKN